MKIAFLLLEHFSTLMRSVLPTIEYLILRKVNILNVKSFSVSILHMGFYHLVNRKK